MEAGGHWKRLGNVSHCSFSHISFIEAETKKLIKRIFQKDKNQKISHIFLFSLNLLVPVSFNFLFWLARWTAHKISVLLSTALTFSAFDFPLGIRFLGLSLAPVRAISQRSWKADFMVSEHDFRRGCCLDRVLCLPRLPFSSSVVFFRHHNLTRLVLRDYRTRVETRTRDLGCVRSML